MQNSLTSPFRLLILFLVFFQSSTSHSFAQELGYEWDEILLNESIGFDDPYSTVENSYGEFLITTYSGEIIMYEPILGGYSIFSEGINSELGISDIAFNHILVLGVEHYWLSTNIGIIEMIDGDPILHTQGLDNVWCGFSTLDPVTGNIWISQSIYGFSVYDGSSFEKADLSPIWEEDEYTANWIKATPEGDIWLGAEEGLVKYNGGIIDYYDVEDDLGCSSFDCAVSQIALTPSGDLWFGSASGLYRLDDEGIHQYTSSNTIIEGNYIYGVEYFDNAIWFRVNIPSTASYTFGLYKLDLDTEDITYFGADETPIFSNTVRTLTLKNDGSLIVTTNEGINILTAIDTNVDDINDTYAEIDVFPNPANTDIMVRLKMNHMNEKAAELSYTLNDVTGRQLLQGECSDSFTLSVRDFPRGIYQLKISDASNRIIQSEPILVK